MTTKKTGKPGKKPAKKAKPAKKPIKAGNSEKSAVEPATPVKKVIGIPFKPGQSGNPSGRPKTKPLTDAYKKVLAKLVPGDKEGRTYADLIAEQTVKQAIKGNIRAAQEVTDRCEGKAMQGIELTGRDGTPVEYLHLTPEERDAEIARLLAETGRA